MVCFPKAYIDVRQASSIRFQEVVSILLMFPSNCTLQQSRLWIPKKPKDVKNVQIIQNIQITVQQGTGQALPQFEKYFHLI